MDKNYPIRHGHSRRDTTTKIYGVWCAIKARCLNPAVRSYERYGGRGIKLCDRWLKFENFLEDMGEPPAGLTIDRLNNDGPYCKDNCAWRTKKEQCRNRRSNALITFGGQTITLVEWSEKTGMSYDVLSRRRLQGWSAERMLTQPVLGRGKWLRYG